MITIESIAKKLGFDPLNPPKLEQPIGFHDDYTPSIWAPLTREEKAFVLKIATGIDIPIA
ncbi:MAG: hypothetical protein IK116_08935 [Firmicutes bacterium]|nr:hypothetical protein [Bacillota bacterium]